VLARVLEAEGFSTMLVTSMPYWAERVGVPRSLAVEFPFGQTVGQPHNRQQQMRVLHEALAWLVSAEAPGAIRHSEETWPVAIEEAQRTWQPAQPSPIIAELAPRFREMLRDARKRSST
jgi:hypothetical protein